MKRTAVQMAKALLLIAGLGVAVYWPGAEARAATLYNVTDLVGLGGTFSSAHDINNLGQVVGDAIDGLARTRAVVFDTSGGGANLDLLTLGGVDSHGLGINDAGKIVGWAHDSGGTGIAVLYDPTGGGANLGLGTTGGGFSSASAITLAGTIVGNEIPPGGGATLATRFDPTGAGANTLLDTGALGSTVSGVGDINAAGTMVGSARIAASTPLFRAVLFDGTGGGMTIDLGTLVGTASEAVAVNALGQIVGSADTLTGKHATLFDPTGGGANIDLGTIGSGPGIVSEARDINVLGQVVGTGSSGAFIIPDVTNPTMLDLNLLVHPSDPLHGLVNLLQANAINDRGQIVGVARFGPSGPLHAFLLTPVVPEPSAFGLIGAGLVAAIVVVRRRRKGTAL